MKAEIKIGDTVSIGDTEWKVVKREGFTIWLIPTHAAPEGRTHRAQLADVSMVKKINTAKRKVCDADKNN
jgi:hypothetical protein